MDRSKTKMNNKKSGPKAVTKKQVEDMIRGEQEVKFLDVVNATTVSYSGSVIALTNVPQGTTNITRIGNEVTPRKLKIRLTASCADAYNVVRVLVFRWNQRFSIDPPDPADILELVASTNAVNSALTHDERSAFKILYDRTVVMVLSTSNNTAQIEIDLKLKQKPISYFGTSSSDQLNGYYIMWISDSSAVTHPGMNYYSRFEYTDS